MAARHTRLHSSEDGTTVIRSLTGLSSRPTPPSPRRLLAGGAAALLAAGMALAAAHLWRIAGHFPAPPYPQPSRLYARVPELAVGAPCRLPELGGQLASLGYQQQQQGEARDRAPAQAPGRAVPAAGSDQPPGTFRLLGQEALSVGLRRFPTPAGWDGGQPLRVEVRAGRIASLRVAGRQVVRAALEPALLASFYGPAVEERWPVRLDEVPPHVVRAVLAAEDDGFFDHSGLSARAIARAAWVDLRGGEVRQGGSTITQQLVKNLYLPRRRTLLRKTKEALLAEIVELRHDKRSLLEAYLNSIYWGRSGPANLIGLGAAARAWFGKPPRELDLAQAAALAAMIRAPAEYSPASRAAALLARRDRVLARLADLGWVGPEEARRARAEALGARPAPLAPRPLAPWFADLAAQEARRRFGVADLAGGGYVLFSTLDGAQQRRAEADVEQELAELTRRSRGAAERPGDGPRRALEAALVSIDPRDGGILAYVGGRDYRRSRFDRLAQAHRPLGSAFKPVVYAAAFDRGVATPATLLDDSPVLVRTGGAFWQPQNYDRAFRGWVTARAALEQSLNVPTVRLALAVGLRRIADLAEAMGLGSPPALPSLALGAVEASPLQVARMYATFATLGRRPTLHALDAVRDRSGISLAGEEVPPARRVLAAPAAYLVTLLLQGAIARGTGSAVRRLGIADPLAGKTGTTSDRRDSWFAGYSPDRVTVVWVGYDDDSGTALSGATAAVPMWSRFMLAVRPPGGFPAFPAPAGLVEAETPGMLAAAAGQAPAEDCRRRLPAGVMAAENPTFGAAGAAAATASGTADRVGVPGSPPVPSVLSGSVLAATCAGVAGERGAVLDDPGERRGSILIRRHAAAGTEPW
jgi:penicillin-binding protein 1B